jgi:hypothetical protein
LIDGTPHAPDLDQGLETFCVMEAVRRAARGAGWVDVAAIAEQVYEAQ